jgi:hypothetical protein
MPIDANMKFLTPPDVEVTVTDAGGGPGTKKIVDLTVSFDPKYVKYLGGAQHADPKGVVLWRKVSCPGQKKVLKLKLERKKAGKTYVVVAVLNPFTGKGKVKGLKMPVAARRRTARRKP